MPVPYSAPMSDELELDGGYTIRVTAVDPTSGNAIAAIVVSNLAMYLDDLTGQGGQGLDVGPFLLVPGSGA